MSRATKTAAVESLRVVRRRGGSVVNLLDYAARVDGEQRRLTLLDAAERAEQLVVDAQIAARAVRAYVARELER